MFGLVPFRRNQGLTKNNGGFNDIDSFFDNFFNDSFFYPDFINNRQMKVDIKDNENEYVVEAEIPGVNKEDIAIDLHDNHLTIAVQKNEEINDERENYICKERRSSSFSRSFYIDNVKNETVNAKFDNGLLTIILPKKEAGSYNSRKIDIQ